MKKFFLFLLVFIGIIDAMAQPLSGKCGKNINWILRNDGTLIVSGYGETYDFGKKPQNATFTKSGIAETIKTVDFTHFSGKINDNLFYGCQNLNTIVLSEKQQCTFSLNAFAGCMITKLELVPEKINKQNRCRYVLNITPELLQKYSIPISTIKHIIINQNSEVWFKKLEPFAPIETYSSLKRGTSKYGEAVIGQWQNGGWNGVVQRTSSSGDDYYRYVRRQIAVEVNGSAHSDVTGLLHKKIEHHTDVGPTNTDFWDIEERLGDTEIQKDYYHTTKNGTEWLYCQTLRYQQSRRWHGIKYKCNFYNGDCFIADNPNEDSLFIERRNEKSFKNTEPLPFKGLFFYNDGSYFYGDFDGNAIDFVNVRSYGLLYPFTLQKGLETIGVVQNSSDILNTRTGKGIFYDRVKNKFIYGLWENGQYKGSPEDITIEDIIDCPFIIPLDFITKTYVNEQLTKWEEKDEFETTQEWQYRTSESKRQLKQSELKEYILSEYLKKFSKNSHLDLQLGTYDADNKYFPVTDQMFGKMNVVLDNFTPQKFKTSWNNIEYIPTFFINNKTNKVDILEIEFLLFDEQINDYRKVAHYNNPFSSN